MRLLKAIVIGAGGHANVVVDVLLSCGYQVLGFLDDDLEKQGKMFWGYKVIGIIDDYSKFDENRENAFVVAIGDNCLREKFFVKLIGDKRNIINAVHESAIVNKNTEIGIGTVVMPRAIINVGAKIGANCIINSGAIVEHDCVIGDHCHIAPGTLLGGGVQIGAKSFLGLGSTVIPYKTIGENSILGAGAVAVCDIMPNSKFVGVPARLIKKSARE